MLPDRKRTRNHSESQLIHSVSERCPKFGKYDVQQGGLQRVILRHVSERYNYGTTTSIPKLSNHTLEEEKLKLRKLYDQARAQGNKKKKKEYKEKISELNRLLKYGQRESNRSKS